VPLPSSTMARRDNTGVEAVLSDELEKWILTAWNGCATPILHTIANVQVRVQVRGHSMNWGGERTKLRIETN
jgi:hypothetical protein